MQTAIPTLSTIGWVNDPYTKSDQLLAYYFSTDAGESFSFRNTLTSIHYTISKYNQDPQALKNAIHNDLDKVFSRYFEIVEPEVTIKESESGQYELIIKVMFNDKNKAYSTSRKLTVQDSTLMKVIKINNEGVEDGKA